MAGLTLTPKPEQTFFWSAPLPDDSEFSPQDPLALDYLHQQVGLWLFPGFTTRTSRAQYYAVILYGLRLVDLAIAAYGERNDDETRVALFERWERFWALSVLESHDGAIDRGHPDAMRGIRGAKRAWRAGDSPIPLDYPLISRQQELGGLGAYLSSLRHYRLVIPGTTKPARLDDEILAAFWAEPDSGAKIRTFEEIALMALDRSANKMQRKNSNITLARLGERARLSSLVEGNRRPQQDRLFRALFETASGPTPILGELVRRAALDGVWSARDVLEGALAGRWGVVDELIRDLLSFAVVFGDFMRETLQAFNDLFDAIVQRGWVADTAVVLGSVFTPARLASLDAASRALLEATLLPRFRAIPVHASALVRFATACSSRDVTTVSEALFAFHAEVQRERGLGGSWMRHDGPRLQLDQPAWSGAGTISAFPNFRISTAQSLLRDLGRIPQ